MERLAEADGIHVSVKEELKCWETVGYPPWDPSTTRFKLVVRCVVKHCTQQGRAGRRHSHRMTIEWPFWKAIREIEQCREVGKKGR